MVEMTGGWAGVICSGDAANLAALPNYWNPPTKETGTTQNKGNKDNNRSRKLSNTIRKHSILLFLAVPPCGNSFQWLLNKTKSLSATKDILAGLEILNYNDSICRFPLLVCVSIKEKSVRPKTLHFSSETIVG